MRKGGDRRLVPVPMGGDEPLNPDTWVLNVVKGKGEIRAGDLIVNVAGHPIRGTMLVTEANGAGTKNTVERLDKLVAVDGTPVGEDVDLIQAIERRPPAGEKHRFEFERGGKRFDIERRPREDRPRIVQHGSVHVRRAQGSAHPRDAGGLGLEPTRSGPRPLDDRGHSDRRSRPAARDLSRCGRTSASSRDRPIPQGVRIDFEAGDQTAGRVLKRRPAGRPARARHAPNVRSTFSRNDAGSIAGNR